MVVEQNYIGYHLFLAIFNNLPEWTISLFMKFQLLCTNFQVSSTSFLNIVRVSLFSRITILSILNQYCFILELGDSKYQQHVNIFREHWNFPSFNV